MYRIIKVKKDKKKSKFVRTVNSRFLFPYFGPKPRNYNNLMQRTHEGEFDSHNNEKETTVWDISDYSEWKEMIEEDERQQKDEENDKQNECKACDRYSFDENIHEFLEQNTKKVCNRRRRRRPQLSKEYECDFYDILSDN